MVIIKRDKLDKLALPGRIIEKAIGSDGFSNSGKMTIGYATYSAEVGKMEPHRHAEETIFVLKSDRGVLRYGPGKSNLPNKIKLEAEMMLHIPEMEWHVFEYDEGGMVDVVYIYGQVSNIRPEEITRKQGV